MLLLGTCKQEHTHTQHRQSAACWYTALRRDRGFDGAACTSVAARAPALLIAHGQVVAVRAARLEPCGQGCIHHAPEICTVLQYVLVRTYYCPECKEPFIFIFLIKPFLYFRTGWYDRVFLLDRFLARDNNVVMRPHLNARGNSLSAASRPDHRRFFAAAMAPGVMAIARCAAAFMSVCLSGAVSPIQWRLDALCFYLGIFFCRISHQQVALQNRVNSRNRFHVVFLSDSGTDCTAVCAKSCRIG